METPHIDDLQDTIVEPDPSRAIHSLQKRYLYRADILDVYPRDIELVSKIAYEGSVGSLNMAGAIALDIAARPNLTSDQQLEWLVYASDIWKIAVDDARQRGIVDIHSIGAATGLATLPSYFDIIYNQRIPDIDSQRSMYEKLCGLAIDAQRLRKNSGRRGDIPTTLRAAGIASELSVLLLHQRFVLHNLGDTSQMVALPSRISEDNWLRNKDQETTVSNGWDVSIMTKYPDDQSPVLAYKVQVKTSQNADDKSPDYASDIVKVNVAQDLIVTEQERKRGRVLVRTIPAECYAELSGNAARVTIKKLNKRTEKLLDVLG